MAYRAKRPTERANLYQEITYNNAQAAVGQAAPADGSVNAQLAVAYPSLY